jgi:hypothetical protein
MYAHTHMAVLTYHIQTSYLITNYSLNIIFFYKSIYGQIEIGFLLTYAMVLCTQYGFIKIWRVNICCHIHNGLGGAGTVVEEEGWDIWAENNVGYRIVF